MALIKIFGQKVCVVKKFAISIHGIDSAKSREACDYDYDFASSFLVVNSDTSMTGKTLQSYPSLSLSSSLSLNRSLYLFKRAEFLLGMQRILIYFEREV